MINWDKVWDTAVNKLHVVLGALCQGSLVFYHYRTHLDIGPILSSTVFAFYGFLLGHAGVYQKWPDKDGGQ